MTVGELIELLKCYDENLVVKLSIDYEDYNYVYKDGRDEEVITESEASSPLWKIYVECSKYLVLSGKDGTWDIMK